MTDAILQIELNLYQAPSIVAFYVLSKQEIEKIQTKLLRDSKRQFYCGSLQGEHSEVKFTGEEVLQASIIITDVEKVAALQMVFGENLRKHYYNYKYFGSCNILDLLQENWDQDKDE